ncbi:MAG: NADAR family protein [Chloroflexota bacterium]
MKAMLKSGLIVLIPEADDDQAAFMDWREAATEHVFILRTQAGGGTILHDLGPRDDACRIPLNIGYRSSDWRIKLISNFAPAPFELDGRVYASVEGFWQGLKFPAAEDRKRIAQLYAGTAKRAGEEAIPAARFTYEGEAIVPGTHAHWKLMERACQAKFSQNDDARRALLATGDRPLTHVMRRDSTTIPGAIMSQIWMRIRKNLAEGRL